MHKKLLAAAVLSAFLLTGLPSVAMAQNVTVTLPTFPVTINGQVMDPLYDETPLIVYKDIVYFPITGDYGAALGLDKTWLWWENTIILDKTVSNKKSIRWFRNTEANKQKDTAAIDPSTLVLNGKTIQISKEPYPLLQFRKVTYFPLTWRLAVEELGWDYSFDPANGLKIQSKRDLEIYGKSQLYSFSEDGTVAVGYPESTFKGYTFTYKIGDGEEKEFDLQSQLLDADYYFNYEADENGFSYWPELNHPEIQGNILRLPSVRVTPETGKENVMLTIDFVEGTVLSITELPLRPVS